VAALGLIPGKWKERKSMDLGLQNKVVLITGGSKGIGLACAKAFLAEGAKVAIVSRSKVNLVAAERQLKTAAQEVLKVAADLIDPANARRMVTEVEQRLGPVDILVNSAGAAKRTPPEDLTPEAWRAAMDAKYFTYVHAIDAVIKGMASRKRGVIVNVVGSGGKVASPTHIPGGAANAALMLVTAGLASAYGRHGIRVNAVNPGATLTDRLKQGMEADAKLAGISPDEALKRATDRVPLGRLAEPEEIANAVLFLASERAGYVTGAIVAMDGAATPIVV
jgi:NAD(P)-dependent dehydrogenase (short-subunit alcohol dehydrogenase family)